MKKQTIFLALFIAFLSYSFWVYTEGTTSGIVMDKNAVHGKFLYQKYNCASCHQIYGLGGYLGPDLTMVCSDTLKSDGYLKAMMISGVRQMPVFPLSNQETDDLVAYLKYVNETSR